MTGSDGNGVMPRPRRRRPGRSLRTHELCWTFAAGVLALTLANVTVGLVVVVVVGVLISVVVP